jgi:phage terminase small subunit
MTVVGSTGQTVLHPLARLRASLETELSAIEQRLGLDPKSRALLGIAVNQYKKSASDLVADIATLAPVSLDD